MERVRGEEMNTLPPRTYKANAGAEKRLLPFGIQHPAKMTAALCRDLFLRYTLPGWVVLDPFFGRGTSLIGCTLGRHVIGVELELPFVEYARANYEYLRAHLLPGLPLGKAVIEQGDSRHLPLPSAADACLTSPPYAEALTYQQAGAGGEHWELLRAGYTPGEIAELRRAGDPRVTQTRREAGYSRSPENIGNLPHAVISSPPYADVASRDRSNEPYCQAQDPVLRARYGSGDTNRHIDGYGHSDGQIGDLPHAGVDDACVSSPPFAETLATSHASQRGWVRANGKPQGFGESTFNDYGSSEGQIGVLRHGGVVHAAVTSPPYMDQHAIGNDNLTGHGLGRSDGKPRGESLQKDRYQEGASLALAGDPETYADACLAVYRECYRVVRPGGALVLVTGNYVRGGEIVDLAVDTIKLAQAAGWTPWECWRHEKSSVSFWRRLHHRQGRPVVTHEDVLVFVKGEQPAWAFADLPPTTQAPANLGGESKRSARTPLPLFALDQEPVK